MNHWLLFCGSVEICPCPDPLLSFLSQLPATRESAFVHAIASAGVAFAVTRSCAEGSNTICGCDSHHKGPPGEGWKWGGCSEDAEFGVLVSREFADARENRPDARSAMNRHNNEAGRTVRNKTDLVLMHCLLLISDRMGCEICLKRRLSNSLF